MATALSISACNFHTNLDTNEVQRRWTQVSKLGHIFDILNLKVGNMDLEKLVREYIDKTIHLSLGTSRDNTPWVCEVHFACDKDLNLYFRSKPTRRHSQEIADNPKVAGNIVRQHALDEPPKGVYFEGTAELLQAGPGRDVAAACLSDRLLAGDKAIEEANNPAGHQFYKITVDKFYLFGEFDEQGTKKHELVWNGRTQ